MQSSRSVRCKLLPLVLAAGAMLLLPVSSVVARAADEEAKPERTDYWIGVRCVDVPELLQAQLDLPAGQGVLVDQVVPGSPAEKAGLKPFDVLFTVDGNPVADPQSLAGAVTGSGGKEVTIEYLRAGKKQGVSVKPTPRPEVIAPQHEDQRFLRQWVERLGRGPAPMNFRFFHPGLVLPPGASTAPPLPDDMTVTIEKQGAKPAKVMVRQGEKEWEAAEDSMEKLPPEARAFAERLLGFGSFDMDGTAPSEPAFVHPGPAARRDLESRLNKRLDELHFQIDELRKAIEQMRQK